MEFAEIPRFKRCSIAPSSTISVSLIPLDFGDRGVYASYTRVQVRGTGRFRGPCELYRKANSELRRLLFSAADQGTAQCVVETRLSGIARTRQTQLQPKVAPGQKLARVRIMLLRNGTGLDREARTFAWPHAPVISAKELPSVCHCSGLRLHHSHV